MTNSKSFGKETENSGTKLATLIQHFLHAKQAEGMSPATVRFYADQLGAFEKRVRVHPRESLLGDLNPTTVREFLVEEEARGMSPATVHARVRALKAFASWLQAEAYIGSNVLANIRRPRLPFVMVEPLTDQEIDALFAAKNAATFYGCRDTAILATLLETGLRRTELVELRFEDAHIDQGYLKVMGKGRKERVVPIGSTARTALWRWVHHFRPEPLNEDHDCLFLSTDGTALTSNRVEWLMKKWGAKAGVPRLHAHLCRHTFATNFLIHRCGDVFRLQQILGHTTLEMVRRYVHYASAEDLIRGAVSSPLDHANIKSLRGYGINRKRKGKKRRNR